MHYPSPVLPSSVTTQPLSGARDSDPPAQDRSAGRMGGQVVIEITDGPRRAPAQEVLAQTAAQPDLAALQAGYRSLQDRLYRSQGAENYLFFNEMRPNDLACCAVLFNTIGVGLLLGSLHHGSEKLIVAGCIFIALGCLAGGKDVYTCIRRAQLQGDVLEPGEKSGLEQRRNELCRQIAMAQAAVQSVPVAAESESRPGDLPDHEAVTMPNAVQQDRDFID